MNTKIIAAGAFAVAVGLLVGPGCAGGGAYGPLGAACPQLSSGNLAQAQISANARANAKIRAFLMATRDLVDVSLRMEAEATQACRAMGRDLGVVEAQLTAQQQSEPGAPAQAACSALAARIDSILQQGFSVQVQAQPPRCEASVQAKARCEAACDVQLDPGQIVAQCEPAKLSGYCQGRCEGRCEGTCQGECQGECTQRDAQGNCIGKCQGECSGGCDGTCHAHCEGQWQAPKCEGEIRAPSADADCDASCRAHAELNAQCTPAQVDVQSSANTEMAGALVSTLRTHLPALIHAEIALGRRIIDNARTVVDVGARLPKVMGDAGAEAVACVAAASSASVKATARINVSVEASAKVTGRVGASG